MNTLTEAIRPFVEKNYIAGAVMLVANKDRVLAHEAVGLADIATQRPMEPDALFWIASMTKPMTATALSMLIDEGKVGLEDPVEKYLPEFKDQKYIAYKDDTSVLLRTPKQPITVRQVLSHTAGLAFALPFEQPWFDHFQLSEVVRFHAAAPLQCEPGTKYGYSNAGTNTAGRIIEIVSGQKYEDFMDERLLHPLGMKDTTFWPSEEQTKRYALVYKAKADKSGLEETPNGQMKFPFSDRNRTPLPAGGLFSTAADCARFCQMILNGGKFEGKRYLSEAAVKMMIAKQTGDLVTDKYGLCFATLEDGAYGHGGAYKTTMFIDPKNGLIRVFLYHHAGDWPNDEAKQIGTAFTTAAEKLL
jgi:CubicO group peptidase (beta-lactamase class C family)